MKKVLNNYGRHLAKHGAMLGMVLDESKAGGGNPALEVRVKYRGGRAAILFGFVSFFLVWGGKLGSFCIFGVGQG